MISTYNISICKFMCGVLAIISKDKNAYKYLTNYAAQEYLKYADTLTVVRILDTGYAPATAIVSSSFIK